MIGNLGLMPLLVERRAHSRGRRQRNRDSGLLNREFLPRRSVGVRGDAESECVMKNLGTISLITAIVLCAGFAAAQTTQPPEASSPASQGQAPVPAQSALPDAPTPQNPPPAVYRPKANDSYNFHVGVLCGAGASTSAAATKPSTGCGVGMVLLPVPVFVEVGVMGPQAGHSNVSAYISVDESINLAKSTRKYVPMALVGYSRLFETGQRTRLRHCAGAAASREAERPKQQLAHRAARLLHLRQSCAAQYPTARWMDEPGNGLSLSAAASPLPRATPRRMRAWAGPRGRRAMGNSCGPAPASR